MFPNLSRAAPRTGRFKFSETPPNSCTLRYSFCFLCKKTRAAMTLPLLSAFLTKATLEFVVKGVGLSTRRRKIAGVSLRIWNAVSLTLSVTRRAIVFCARLSLPSSGLVFTLGTSEPFLCCNKERGMKRKKLPLFFALYSFSSCEKVLSSAGRDKTFFTQTIFLPLIRFNFSLGKIVD